MDEYTPEDEVVVGGPLSRVSVAVRISGDELDPSEITRIFGVAPKFAARKGEQRARGSRPVSHATGIWTFALVEDPSPEWELDDAIEALLGRLPSDLGLWRELGSRFTIDVFCGLFMGSDNQGADLRASTLRMLADRGMKLELDIYGPPPDDQAT
jgi:hypothetical protein